MNQVLSIEPAGTAEKVIDEIHSHVNRHQARCVVLGLSGGIDSAVLASLGVRALGPERVHVYYLYDRDSSMECRAYAEQMAERLGLNLQQVDISPEMNKLRIYDSPVMALSKLSGRINRFLNTRGYRLFGRQRPFVAMLREQGRLRTAPGIMNRLYNSIYGRIENAFTARHRYRRTFLEEKAKEFGGIVLGAANRSEVMVGWFVKNGVDDMPMSPIAGLFKTQVLELAEYLEIPDKIRLQTPTPDMLKGMTDETAMGITYTHLDIILSGMDGGSPDEDIIRRGVTEGQIAHVRNLMALSEWKRRN